MPLPLLPTIELDVARIDRHSLLARLQTLAYQAVPYWSDFSVNHPENVLLESQALIGGTIGAVLNERCRQLNMATVSDRLAMIRLANPLSYELIAATAAQVDGVFYLPNSAVATKLVTLPIGTRLESGGNQYQTRTAITILVGSNASGTVTVENAEGQNEDYNSDEQPNQVLQLAMANAIEDSVGYPGHIYVVAGDGWYKDHLESSSAALKSFHEAGPDDRVFIPMTDNNGRVYLFFGNSINGKIPAGSIAVEYKTGGGEDGRVGALATDWKVLDTVYDSDNNAVTVLFRNPAESIGGYGRTTVDEARTRAPLARRTLERGVNEEDMEYIAGLTAGVARAAMITSNMDSSVPEDEGRLYVVAYGSPYSDSGYYPPATPTSAQITSIETMIDAALGSHPQLMGVSVSVLAATFTDVTVAARIYKESGFTAAQVKANITESLQKFFAVATDTRQANPYMAFGYKLLDANGDSDYKIAWSKVLNAVNDTEGVREVAFTVNNLLLNTIRQSVILGPSRFPRLSTITVYDMDNSGVII